MLTRRHRGGSIAAFCPERSRAWGVPRLSVHNPVAQLHDRPDVGNRVQHQQHAHDDGHGRCARKRIKQQDDSEHEQNARADGVGFPVRQRIGAHAKAHLQLDDAVCRKRKAHERAENGDHGVRLEHEQQAEQREQHAHQIGELEPEVAAELPLRDDAAHAGDGAQRARHIADDALRRRRPDDQRQSEQQQCDGNEDQGGAERFAHTLGSFPVITILYRTRCAFAMGNVCFLLFCCIFCRIVSSGVGHLRPCGTGISCRLRPCGTGNPCRLQNGGCARRRVEERESAYGSFPAVTAYPGRRCRRRSG